MTVKVMYRLTALIMTVFMLASINTAHAVDDAYPSTYTYNYDYWSDVRESPDAYRVERVVYAGDLGVSNLKKPQSLFVQGNDLYICDTGNNRILQVRRENGVYTLVREITAIAGSDVANLNTPSDVFADAEGTLYIADTGNNRVVKVDKDLNFLQAFVKPTDATFDQSLSFMPSKVVADVSGRTFVLATNVNKGLIKFESDGTFTGFVGANKVTYNFVDYVWKNYLSTKEQRAQQASFVPTEYHNIYIDPESFIYATNIVFSEYDLLWDNAQPIRRLNGIGNDILIKNDHYPPIGDLYWIEQSVPLGPSKLVDITVLEDDVYVAVDRTRGRIFGYDSQGVMLWAFGTSGSTEGAFSSAVSIEHMGRDLFVLDELNGTITVFTPTEYGNLIYDAVHTYLTGDYSGSAKKWEEVLKLNANYNMAFIGIGRSLMRDEQYKEAMECFEMANDRDNYGRAFRFYRADWVEDNILWMVGALALILVIPVVRSSLKKMRMEVEAYERDQVKK